jgi:hypothetical protein
MKVDIVTEVAQFPFWEYFLSDFRYSIFAAYFSLESASGQPCTQIELYSRDIQYSMCFLYRERLNGFLGPGDGTNILPVGLTADVIQDD